MSASARFVRIEASVSLSRTLMDARPGSLRQQGAPRGGCSTVGPDRFIQAGFRFAHGAGRRDGGIDTTVAGDRGSLCKNLSSSVEVSNAGLGWTPSET